MGSPAPADELLLPAGVRLVHIGPPKTGTTSLQNAFHHARGALAEQGVRYAGPTSQPLRAVHAGLRRPLLGGPPPPPGNWRRLAEEVRRAREPRVVISSEAFAYAEPEAIPGLLADLELPRVHVVATLRPLARILPSQWQQSVQSGTVASYGGWLDAILNQRTGVAWTTFWALHRHDELVARWAAVVGPANVTAVVVDDRDHRVVLAAFERLLGLRPGTLVVVPDLANRSLTLPEVEAVRALNAGLRAGDLLAAPGYAAIRLQAAQAMKERTPDPGEPRIETPAWAVERVEAVAREIVAGIAASGVRVVGDLERLVRVADGHPGAPTELDGIPPAVVASLAMGILATTGAGPSRRTREPELAGVSTRRLAAILARRIARAARRRLPA